MEMALLTTGSAARILGISTVRVIQMANEGKLRHVRDSMGRRLFREKEVLEMKSARDARAARRATTARDRSEVAAPGI